MCMFGSFRRSSATRLQSRRWLRRVMCEQLENRELLAADFGDHQAARLLREMVAPGPEVVYYDYVADAADDGRLSGGVVDLASVLADFGSSSQQGAAPIVSPPPNVETIRSNGATVNRIDVVIVGDGYTVAELDSYKTHAANTVDGILSFEIFGDYASFFNVHRVDVISNESGVDHDPTRGVLRDTALDMGYWCSDIERLLCVDPDKAETMAANAPDVDQIIAVANSSKYGGAGYPSRNIGTVAGANDLALDIAIHELGHSFGDLADEYDYGGPQTYTGPELAAPNVSIKDAATQTAEQVKWHLWLDEPNVDTFEGANYSELGVYRPTDNSMMRNLNRPFEQVNTEQLIISAYKTVQPIDDSTAPGMYPLGQIFFVDPVDPLSHDLDIQWFVDGMPVAGQTGTTFDSAAANLASGEYSVSVTVVDPTDKVRDESLRDLWMTETRSWELRVAIDVSIDSGDIDYVEDSAPILAMPAAIVNDPSRLNYAGNQFIVSVNGMQPTDVVSFDVNQGVAIAGGELVVGGNVLGSLQMTARGVEVVLTDAATPDTLQTVLRSLSFESTGNSPVAGPRELQVSMQGDAVFPSTLVRTIIVIPTNDSPVIGDGRLRTINEDAIRPLGQRVGDLFAGTFADPDLGDGLLGIAVISNPQNSGEGDWQFSTDNGFTWTPIGAVDDANQSLVLGTNALLGFLPAQDFFGNATPLGIRGIDRSYQGNFTSFPHLAYLPNSARQVNGAVSTNFGNLDLTVLNVNDPPIANQASVAVEVVQDQPLSWQLATNLFTDIDSDLVWSLSGTQFPNWLQFDPSSRTLSGTPRNRDVGTSHLSLRVMDGSGESAAMQLQLTVIDVNDPPQNIRFTTRPVQENQSGISLGAVSALDPDPGDVLNWSVSDSRFEIRGGELFLISPINYEHEQVVTFTITASDSGVPSLATQRTVSLEVIDENEFAPRFSSVPIQVLDQTPAGTQIHTVDATDEDVFQTVTYRLVGDAKIFAIDANTGAIALSQPASYSNASSHRIFVEATDNGKGYKSSTVQFNIDVLPVNAFPPEIPAQSFTVPENSTAGTVVGQIVASDADGTPLNWEIVNGSGNIPADWLTIDSTTGVVSVTGSAAFDYESVADYEFVARVTEQDAPFRSATATITINVTDANDPPHRISLDANRIPTFRSGFHLGQLVVGDQDSSTYAFSSDDPRFAIVGGGIQLAADFGFAADATGAFEILVQVTETGNAANTVTLPLEVEVVFSPSWQNHLLPMDVNGDGVVSPRDALMVVNELNSTAGSRRLSDFRTAEELVLGEIDVNGDHFVTPSDALAVITFLNTRGLGEAESEPVATALLPIPFCYQTSHWVDDELRKNRKRR